MPRWCLAVFISLEWIWALLGAAFLCLAALCALRSDALERLDAALLRAERGPWPDVLFGALIPGLFALYKSAQFASFQMMTDTATMLNMAWNTAHGDWLYSSALAGRSYLAVHFAFIIALLSPLLRIWPSPLALIVPQGLAIGLAVWALYRGVRSLSPGLPAWLAAALLLSHPLFHGAAVTVLDSVVFAPALFLAACALHARRRDAAAAAFIALLLLTREQAPMTLFGIGAAILAAKSSSRSRAWGAGLMVFSVALWFGEMTLIQRSRQGWSSLYDHWDFYAELGGSPTGLLRTLLTRPELYARSLVWPPVKCWIVVRALLGFALLPLAGGVAALPAAATWLPQQLASSSSTFMRLEEHYGAMLLGPLAWAAAAGLVRLWRRRDRRPLIAALTALAAGTNFLQTAFFSPPVGVLPSSWTEAVPQVASCVPPSASLWVDEFVSPQFALRRDMRPLPFAPNPVFESRLFRPDRVLLSRYWLVKADPAVSASIMGRLSGYRAICSAADLVVLAPPQDGEPAAAAP